jgi:drug/metabolite transporter (DMT)-like permease
MIPFILGLITAFTYAGQSLVGKRLSSELSPSALSFFTFFPAIPFLLGLNLFVSHSTIHWIPFLSTAFISFTINVLAWTFFYKAVTLAPVGLIVPITALTPLFIVPVEYLMLGDLPKMTAFFGIIITIAGMFILYYPHRIRPEREVKKGIIFAIATAALWSVSATVDKIAIQNSNPFQYGLFIYILLAVFFYFRSSDEITITVWKKQKIWILLLGMVSSILIIAQFFALLMTNVSLVILLKRSGAIISVIGGKAFFKESHFFYYFLGSLIVVLGVVIIGFSMN